MIFYRTAIRQSYKIEKREIMDKKKIGRISVLITAVILVISGITVSAAKKNIKFKTSRQTIYVGKKITLKAVVLKKYKKKTSKIKWSSTNRAVASVNKHGKVTAKKAGKTYIKAKLYGTTAKCLIVVKKKTKPAVKVTPKPTAVNTVSPSTEPTKCPEKADTPVVTKEPCMTDNPSNTETPEPSRCPFETSSPENSTKPLETPTVSMTPEPATTSSPQPIQSCQPSGKLTPVSTRGAVVAYGVAKIDNEIMTVYLVDRDYDGNMTIGFKDKKYSMSGKVKDSLVMLDTTYISKTNSAGTIRVSRVKPEVYWTLTDLTDNDNYYFSVERRNSYDKSYKNCGALYFKGDVTSVLSIY